MDSVKDEQADRIRENMAYELDDILDNGDFDGFMDLFEDRDPFEFI